MPQQRDKAQEIELDAVAKVAETTLDLAKLHGIHAIDALSIVLRVSMDRLRMLDQDAGNTLASNLLTSTFDDTALDAHNIATSRAILMCEFDMRVAG